jgi:hypothetical protein
MNILVPDELAGPTPSGPEQEALWLEQLLASDAYKWACRRALQKALASVSAQLLLPIREDRRERRNEELSEAQGALDAVLWASRRYQDLEAKLERRRG